VLCSRRGLTQFASLLSYLNWAGRIGDSWCSPSVGPGFTTILAPYNGVRATIVTDGGNSCRKAGCCLVLLHVLDVLHL